jgi:DNA replication and repair protein RecF
MHLENIILTNFKNYENVEFDFSPEINCLTGKNGSGKTNVLDAIYFSCITRSAFQHKDKVLLYPERDFYLISSSFKDNNQQFEVKASFEKRKKKVFKIKGRAYEKLSEHIGRFPVVMITPYDTDLIREGSEFRRKFFDGIVCQFDQQYLQDLVKYNTILKNRNSLLKHFYDQRYFDKELLETYDEQLFPLNQSLATKRVAFLETFNRYFLTHYDFLCSGTTEEVSLTYKSNVGELIQQDFFSHRKKDQILQRTSIGIHRDDYIFKLNDHPVKQMGSQGQQKSFILALQLAKFSVLHERKETKPILLLDDIFDKLDESRINRLIELMTKKQFGQVFITDASNKRVRNFIKDISMRVRLFTIDEGQLKNTEDV